MDGLILQRQLELSGLAAHVMLENGGETYRAEETVLRINRPYPEIDAQVLALPTGVFITLSAPGLPAVTGLRRVRKRAVNLQKLDDCNRIARQLEQGGLAAEEALQKLRELLTQKPGPRYVPILAAAFSSAFFALLFGGSLPDFLSAFAAGALVSFISVHFGRNDLYHFVISLTGGLIIAAAALLGHTLFGGNVPAVIAGAMMPLLPGLAMTNAIRDTMHGDLVSGVARAADAALVAISLAAGAGLGIGIYYLAGGMLA